jgi:hypothetical protein
MVENGLRGPFALSDSIIDEQVSPDLPGAYVLGESDDLVNFRVVFVGRSDINVNNQLHVHVGSYTRFKFQYCSSAQHAFEKECGLYHDFVPFDNPIHPQRPAGTAWKCPRCSLLG